MDLDLEVAVHCEIPLKHEGDERAELIFQHHPLPIAIGQPSLTQARSEGFSRRIPTTPTPLASTPSSFGAERLQEICGV